MAEVDTNQKIADLAVESGSCSADQVAAGQAEVARLRDLGIEKSLADVLFERGQLDERQRERLIAVAQPNPLARLLPGYELLGPIGKGGMGVVYKARHLGLDKLVAVKVLPPKFANDPNFVDRFLREARAAGKLNHENIVHAIDAGEQKGYYYYIMEYVEGETAKQRLRRDGPLAEPAAIDLLYQMGEALAHAHRHDLIHRDVKPENILFDAEGTAKLCDLGLARVTTEDASAGSKMATFGTPLYISPEQILTPHHLDGRCDLYSLGATVYHLVCNTPPYYGDTKAETVAGHLSPDPPPLASVHNPGLSKGFVRVLARMLEKDRERRYVSAEALVADLADLRAGREPGRIAEESGTGRVWLIAAALGVLAVLVTWFLARGGGENPTPIQTETVARTHTPTTSDPTPGPTPAPAPAPTSATSGGDPGAAAFAALRTAAREAQIPSTDLCAQLADLCEAHPEAAWAADATALLEQLRQQRRVAAAEALRTALATPGAHHLLDAGTRYADTAPGRAATRAAAFRQALAADTTIARIAAAARAEAGGDHDRAAQQLAGLTDPPDPVAMAPLERLKAARAAMAALREQDAAALAEARYQRDIGEAWALAADHRFAEARDRARALADQIADAEIRGRVANADQADFEALAALGAAARAELTEAVVLGDAVTLRLRTGRVQGQLRMHDGQFAIRDAQRGDVPANLPDLPASEVLRLAEARLAADRASTLAARGVLFFLHGDDEAAKTAFDRAIHQGASRHRFRDAIAGRELGAEELGAVALRDGANAELQAGNVVAARQSLLELLREPRFRATNVLRQQGVELRQRLGETIAQGEAAYAAPLRAAAQAIEAMRAPDLAVGQKLAAAVLASDFSGARRAAEELLLLARVERGRLAGVVANALEAAPPGVVQPWLPTAWRQLAGPGPTPADAVAAWTRLAGDE